MIRVPLPPLFALGFVIAGAAACGIDDPEVGDPADPVACLCDPDTADTADSADTVTTDTDCTDPDTTDTEDPCDTDTDTEVD